MNKRILLFILSIFLFSGVGFSQVLKEKVEQLSKLYNFTFRELPTDTFFSEKYLLEITQLTDHQNPASETFTQRVYLAHRGFERPVVFITEGYSAGYAAKPNYINELSTIVDANQVCVEHRFFGESAPKTLVWKDLTVFNAATDHHKIVEILKQIYTSTWVNTGISKGGQTAMYHRYFYPGDVDATVGYVCPLNFSIEDKRVYRFLEHVGDSTSRKIINEYQKEMLSNKSIYLPVFEALAKKRKLSFSHGLIEAYELTVLEYSFAFWQWGTVPLDSIPKTPENPEKMVNHLNQVAGIDWISDQGISRLQPFFYQALAEIGFYGYDISHFKGLVSFSKNPDFSFTAPESISINYNPLPMQEIDAFVRHQGENMIFIYGETDPWSATAVDLTYNTNSINIVKPGGSHLTRIGNLPEDQKELVITTLRKWLKQ